MPYDNEHQPELLKEVITKYNGRTIITGFLPASPSYKEPMIFTGIQNFIAAEFLKECRYADGSVCGYKEEE